MEDESGEDEKILAVPVTKLDPYYDHVKNYTDVPLSLLNKITHFFEHYKDLEPNKWVRVKEWAHADRAAMLIEQAIIRGSNAL